MKQEPSPWKGIGERLRERKLPFICVDIEPARPYQVGFDVPRFFAANDEPERELEAEE